MSEVKLTAEPRTEFGKGAARRLRRAHKVPAVLYGHGTDPVHVSLDGHATMLALKQSNALLTLSIEGRTELALPKDVQRDVLRGFIEHVDLLLVRRGEKVTVDVPLAFSGEPAPGGMVQTELNTLTVEVEATAIPESIAVSVAGLEVGTQVHARDVVLPEGVTLAADGDLMIVHVTGPGGSAGGDADSDAAEGASA